MIKLIRYIFESRRFGWCPECGGKVENIEKGGHINTGDRAHIHVYQGSCSKCNLELFYKWQGPGFRIWSSDNPYKDM